MVLGQTELLERCTSSDLDLCRNNIDTSDLFGNGVLDLAKSTSVIPYHVSIRYVLHSGVDPRVT
jgi:hypothetical protein